MKLVFTFGLWALIAIQHAQAVEIEDCFKLALSKGIPEIGMPSHNPLIVHNGFTVHLSNLLGSNFTFTTSKIIWYHIPDYNITKKDVVKNTTEVLEYEGEVTWNNLTITFDYDLEYGNLRYIGDIEYYLKDVVWSGGWEETKPNAAGIKKVNKFSVKQTKATKSVKTMGFGIQTVFFEALLLVLYDAFVEIHVNDLNLVGNGFADRINKYWYGKPDMFKFFVKWCNAQEF